MVFRESFSGIVSFRTLALPYSKGHLSDPKTPSGSGIENLFPQGGLVASSLAARLRHPAIIEIPRRVTIHINTER